MEVSGKLGVLGNSARWDSSCGGCGKPVKVLYTNRCVHDCRYCVNSTCSSAGREKTSFSPSELARVFMGLYRARKTDGLFLSSGVGSDPESVSGGMLRTVELLRKNYGFRGYVHLKVLPGVSFSTVRELATYADRMSVNLEAPSKGRFSELSSTKDFGKDLVKRLGWLSFLSRRGFLSAGFTTQFVVGPGGENDLEYLRAADSLYKKTSLRRAYFSAFDPIMGTRFEGRQRVPELREARLYEADWLLRFYGFGLGRLEEVLDDSGNLPLDKDPKYAYALQHPDLFPVDPNEAEYLDLLMVPGVGPKTAKRMLAFRDSGGKIESFSDFSRICRGARKALPFLELGGRRQARLSDW